MSKFEQLLDNILDCVTESVEDMVIETEPAVIDSITESVINGDISVDECILLLESVDNSKYHISVLERFTEGIIDNDECIVLLEATRYEKEHTKALQELRKQNEETEEKIKALKKIQKTASDSVKEKITLQIKKLEHDLSNKLNKYKENYSRGDYYSSPLDNESRLEIGKENKSNVPIESIRSRGEEIKDHEISKKFNTPSTKVREPGLYLKAYQGK